MHGLLLFVGWEMGMRLAVVRVVFREECRALLKMKLMGNHQTKPIAGVISHPLQTNVYDHISPLKLGVSLEVDASKDGTDIHDKSARKIRSSGILLSTRPFRPERKSQNEVTQARRTVDLACRLLLAGKLTWHDQPHR